MAATVVIMDDSRIPDLSSVASPARCDLAYEDLEMGELISSGEQEVVHEAYVSTEGGTLRLAIKQPMQNQETLLIETIDRFLEEAKTWATIDAHEREKSRWNDSEHIVGVIDIGDQLPWIALEYMDGGGLDEYLEEHSDGLPLEEALWIGECICKGVEVAHNHGIPHLDLKPANVLFKETSDSVWNVPKVSGWGLSRVPDAKTGSVDDLSDKYAAPEQCDPEQFGDPDMLTDIYQIGGLVYEMLTGSPPHTNPKPPSKHREGVSPELDSTVMATLEPRKEERFQSVVTFGEALRAVRTGDELPPTVTTRLSNHPQRSTSASDSRTKLDKNTIRRYFNRRRILKLGTASVPMTALAVFGYNYITKYEEDVEVNNIDVIKIIVEEYRRSTVTELSIVGSSIDDKIEKYSRPFGDSIYLLLGQNMFNRAIWIEYGGEEVYRHDHLNIGAYNSAVQIAEEIKNEDVD